MQNQQRCIVRVAAAAPVELAVRSDRLDRECIADIPLHGAGHAPIFQRALRGCGATVSVLADVPSRIVRATRIDEIWRDRRRWKRCARTARATTDGCRKYLRFIDRGKHEGRTVL